MINLKVPEKLDFKINLIIFKNVKNIWQIYQ